MYSLPKLPYEYDALEPVISEEIMRLHHSKHHQTYIDKLNQAMKDRDGAPDIEQVLRHIDDLPEDVRTVVRNQGGGHYNHSQFWQWITSEAGQNPGEKTRQLLESKYGGVEKFVDEFTTKATGLFGSGWVWLQPDGAILTTQNQDNPIMKGEPAPILGLDVWEHAYYLDYKNQRNIYIEKWWQIVNWSEVEKRLQSAIIS